MRKLETLGHFLMHIPQELADAVLLLIAKEIIRHAIAASIRAFGLLRQKKGRRD